MNEPFKNLDDLVDAHIQQEVPPNYVHFAIAWRRRPGYWDDMALVEEDMRLEAVPTFHIRSIMRMLEANKYLVAEYLEGAPRCPTRCASRPCVSARRNRG